MLQHFRKITLKSFGLAAGDVCEQRSMPVHVSSVRSEVDMQVKLGTVGKSSLLLQRDTVILYVCGGLGATELCFGLNSLRRRGDCWK